MKSVKDESMARVDKWLFKGLLGILQMVDQRIGDTDLPICKDTLGNSIFAIKDVLKRMQERYEKAESEAKDC